MMPVKRLSLTDFKCAIPRGAREKNFKARPGQGRRYGQMGRDGMGKETPGEESQVRDDGLRSLQAHGCEEEAIYSSEEDLEEEVSKVQ